MNRLSHLPMAFCALLVVCLFCSSCSLNQTHLRTELADRPASSGTYTVILYGANHYNDIASAAFLIPEGGKYTFDIFAPRFAYRVVSGLSPETAMQRALTFVSWHGDYMNAQISKILDTDGLTIGYEIRPLYRPTAFGMIDVMQINYFLKNPSIVTIYVKLDPDIERQLVTGGDKGSQDSQ
jgi:hypothetical protein